MLRKRIMGFERSEILQKEKKKSFPQFTISQTHNQGLNIRSITEMLAFLPALSSKCVRERDIYLVESNRSERGFNNVGNRLTRHN